MSDAKVAEISESVADNRGWFIALGVALIILGIICIAYPLMSAIAMKVFLGWMFLIGGIAQVIHSFSTKSWDGFLWDLLVGLLYILVGGWLAFFPIAGVIALTTLVALTFIAEGVMKLILGFDLRPADGWFWVSLSGIVGVVVGILLISGLPGTATWAIGLFVGINFLFSGWSFIAIPVMARNA